MKIVIEEIQSSEEEEIIIKCKELSPQLLRVVAQLKAGDSLVAYDGSKIYRIKPQNIYYFEVIDNNTFIYCQQKVYESKQKLYELEEALAGGDFLRVSKSVILNLGKISSLSPALNGRFEATLQNNEKVIISRQYVNDLKKVLGL